MAKVKLEQDIDEAVKLKRELEKQHKCGTEEVNELSNHVKQLQAQAHDFKQQTMRAIQAEASQIEEDMQKIEQEINVLQLNIICLKEEENKLDEALQDINKSVDDIGKEIDESASRFHYLRSQINDLHGRQDDKVTSFGGERVSKLLKSIKKRAKRFEIPPIGPIGVHVQLASDFWSVAIDCALGRLLDAFIVSCHKDFLLLRDCAKEADYCGVQIIIYDFAKPRLNIPAHCLPSTTHPTIFSVIHSDNPTVQNVLIDMGHIERQVLVQDYEVGKSVAFYHRIRNLKEVYTSDGFKIGHLGYGI